jgi:hypothetical protein
MKQEEVLMKMWNDALYDTSSSRREFDCKKSFRILLWDFVYLV